MVTLSLSAVVPVFNAESRLAAILTNLIEVLPDLTPRWDLLLVDDGSNDATGEVAQEFIHRYPQVRLARHAERWGRQAVYRTGCRMTKGDVLLFRAEDCDLDLSGIHKMWRRMATLDVVVSRSAGRSPLGWIPPLPTGRVTPRSGGRAAFEMIRRRAIEGWRLADDGEDLQAFLARRGLPQHEVELRPAAPPAPAGAFLPSTRPAAVVRPSHCDQGTEQTARPKRPNYLSRLRAFAWGE